MARCGRFSLTLFLALTCHVAFATAQKTDVSCERSLDGSCEEARAHLSDAGVTDAVHVFFWNASADALGCLGGTTPFSNLLQVCSLRSLFGGCETEANVSRLAMNRCYGRRCRGSESEATTLCVLDLVGIAFTEDGSEEDGFVCGLPPSEAFLLEWGDPPWAQGLNDLGKSHCLSNLPPGTLFQRRMGCRDGQPRVQYRALFEDYTFLKSRRDAECWIDQVCGGEQMYASKTICFEYKD